MNHLPYQTLSSPIHQKPQTLSSRITSPQKSRHLIFFLIGALSLIIAGTIIWVLNIVGIIPGPWSSVFGAIFTGTGIIIAILDSLLAIIHTERTQA